MLVADEVYQTNVYAEGKAFTSFKKVGGRVIGSCCHRLQQHSAAPGIGPPCAQLPSPTVCLCCPPPSFTGAGAHGDGA